jgi:hypothetical protein
LPEDDVEIELIDDTPEQDKGRKPLDREVEDPTEEELGSYSANVRKRLDELTHARHDERRAKEALSREKTELERLAQQLLEENRTLKRSVNDGSKQMAETVKTAADMSLDMAKQKFKAAYETGDPDAIMEAQQELTEAQLRAQTAKNFRPTALQVDEDGVQQRQHVERQPQPQVVLDEATQKWQQRNRWFGDPEHVAMTSYALGLHQELARNGITPAHSKYYENVDSRMRSTFPDFFGTAASQSGEAARTSRSVVAPSARTSSGPKKVRLTSTSLALAKRLGISPKQYAEQMAKLEKANG